MVRNACFYIELVSVTYGQSDYSLKIHIGSCTNVGLKICLRTLALLSEIIFIVGLPLLCVT